MTPAQDNARQEPLIRAIGEAGFAFHLGEELLFVFPEDNSLEYRLLFRIAHEILAWREGGVLLSNLPPLQKRIAELEDINRRNAEQIAGQALSISVLEQNLDGARKTVAQCATAIQEAHRTGFLSCQKQAVELARVHSWPLAAYGNDEKEETYVLACQTIAQAISQLKPEGE